MIFSNAVLTRTSTDVASSALLRACSAETTVARLARAVRADTRLQQAYPSPEAVLLELLALDAAGAIRLSVPADGDALQSYYETGNADGDRSLAYVATYEKNWCRYRHLYDFVGADDANGRRKAFQRDLYLDHLAPHLGALDPGAAVLDAGCGVGRLTGALLAQGLRVTAADASTEALKCAVRVGLESGATADTLGARLCDVSDLGCFADDSFAATVSLEVICYQDNPAASLAELVRVTAPGGLLALSVEGLHGSLLADAKLGAAQQAGVLDTAALDVEDEISVRYFTKDSLGALLRSVGLEFIEVTGTHYTADGVFDRLATDEALADPDQLRGLAELERTAAVDPVLAPLARAWLATTRVPGVKR